MNCPECQIARERDEEVCGNCGALLRRRPGDERISSADPAGATPAGSGRAKAAAGDAYLRGPAAGSPAVRRPAARLQSNHCEFIGRRHELDSLTSELDAALSGRPRVLLITGEAGIGKTRLAIELRTRAEDRGFQCFSARCYEGADSPDYGPWAQWLRNMGAQLGLDELRRIAGVSSMWLSRLEPSLNQGEAVPSIASRAATGARLRVFEAVAEVLAALAQRQAQFIFLDDLQWTDPASGYLLEFLAGELHDCAVCVVATYRDEELDPKSDLSAIVENLRRAENSYALGLSGLEEEEVAQLVQSLLAQGGSSEITRMLARRTHGNPLFIRELLRQLGDDLQSSLTAEDLRSGLGKLRTIPLQVHGVLEKRIAKVSRECRMALAAGSVLGEEFDITRVAYMLDRRPVDLLTLVDEAVESRLISPLEQRIGAYEFEHGLIREELYQSLAVSQRSELHGKALAAIEELHKGAEGAYTDELAYHAAESALSGDLSKALEYTRSAASNSLSKLAFEKAVRHYERLSWLLSLDTAGREHERCRCLIALAHARHAAGDVPGSERAFSEAFALAEALLAAGSEEAAELLGKAAIAIEHKWGRSGVFESTTVARLEKAAAHVKDKSLLSAVLGRLAAAYYWSDQIELRDELSSRAVTLARKSGSDDAVAYALMTRRFAIWSVDRSDEQVALGDEIISIAKRARRKDLMMAGVFWRVIDAIELGDVARVERDVAEYSRYADESGLPYYRWYAGVMNATRTIMHGDLEAAFGKAERAKALGTSAGITDADQFYGIAMVALSRLNGALGMLCEQLAEVVNSMPRFLTWRATYAAALASAGRESEARREIDIVAADDFAGLARDGSFLTACALLAEALFTLGDGERAKQVYELLRPFSNRHIVVASAAGYFGFAGQYLGILAATQGDHALAHRHFDAAITEYRRIVAPLFEARVESLKTQTTPATGSISKPDLISAQAPVAAVVHQRAAAGNASTLASTQDAANSSRPGLQIDSTFSVFHREGEVWEISFAGRTARVRDSKGMAYLALLLYHPGRELHVIDMVATVSGAATEEHASIAADAAGAAGGAILDSRAKAEYRHRMEDLRSVLAEAEQNNDVGTARLARQELELITEELSRALGLGGRDRKSPSGSERARVNVSRAIHSGIAKISNHHQKLGQHLNVTVRTGAFCCYTPDPRVPIEWKTSSPIHPG